MSLTNQNKLRHRDIFRLLLNGIASNNIPIREVQLDQNYRTGPVIQGWTWGPIGKRLGSIRSADGVIFELDNKKAVKIIFSEDDSPLNEIKITRIAGDAGIAPKVHAAYVVDIPPTFLTAFKNYLTNKTLNIFQNYNETPMNQKGFKHMYMFIMDKLDGFPLAEVLRGMYNIQLSVEQFVKLVAKMHGLGIIHADMHMSNIWVQVFPSGRIKLKLIDFGRSYYLGRPVGTLDNANNYLLRRQNRPMVWYNTRNGKPSHVVPRNGLPRYRNKAAAMNAAVAILGKYGQIPVPASITTPPKVKSPSKKRPMKRARSI